MLDLLTSRILIERLGGICGVYYYLVNTYFGCLIRKPKIFPECPSVALIIEGRNIKARMSMRMNREKLYPCSICVRPESFEIDVPVVTLADLLSINSGRLHSHEFLKIGRLISAC